MEAKALFDFTGQTPQELSFKRNADLLITDMNDPSWFKAEGPNLTNPSLRAEGFVPSNHIEVLPCEWFHGKISRQKAEDELKSRGRHGTYLVRESESQPGGFSLSVRQGPAVQHYKVMRNSVGRYHIWDEAFDSINSLCAHYQHVSVARDGPALTLAEALPKRGQLPPQQMTQPANVQVGAGAGGAGGNLKQSMGGQQTQGAPMGGGMGAGQGVAAAAVQQQQQAAVGAVVQNKNATGPAPVKAPIAIMIAQYDFTPQEPGELEFKRNDRIEVLYKPEDQWWFGRCRGHEGLFPKVYCRDE